MKLFDRGKITSNDEVRNYFSIFSPALLCLSSVTTSRFHCNLLVIELKLARQMLDNDEQFCIDKYQKTTTTAKVKSWWKFFLWFCMIESMWVHTLRYKRGLQAVSLLHLPFFIGIIKIAHTKLQLLRKDRAYWKRLIFFSVLIKKVFIAVHKINKKNPQRWKIYEVFNKRVRLQWNISSTSIRQWNYLWAHKHALSFKCIKLILKL